MEKPPRYRPYKTSAEWLKETDWEMLTFDGWDEGNEGFQWNHNLIDRKKFNDLAGFSGYRTENPAEYQRWQVYWNRRGSWDLFATAGSFKPICNILNQTWEKKVYSIASCYPLIKKGYFSFKVSKQGETYEVKLIDGSFNFYDHPLEFDQPGYNRSYFEPPFLSIKHPFFVMKQ